MTIEYRTLNYKDTAEVREYLRLLYAISAEGDAYHFDKPPEFIDRCVIKARREENPSNTFAGLALQGRDIVGLHLVRRFEEGPCVGAHIGAFGWLSVAGGTGWRGSSKSEAKVGRGRSERSS